MTAASASKISTSGAAFFSSLCASTFGLGCWQAARYFEKIEMVEERQKELAMSPIALERHAKCSIKEMMASSSSEAGKDTKELSNGTDGEDRGFKRILVQGKFRHENEVLIGPRGPPPGAISSSGPNSGRSTGGMSSSPQGFYVITPMERPNNMGTVLVNRGWVPRQYVLQKASWDKPTGMINIVGVPSKTEEPKFMSPPHNEKEPNQLLWFDRNAIESVTQTKGQSPMLMTETDTPTNIDDGSNDIPEFPVKPSAETVGEFTVMPSTHAGYAATWFGLSGAGVLMTRKLITRGRF